MDLVTNSTNSVTHTLGDAGNIGGGVGGVIGSFVPGIGTAIGAFIGKVFGSFINTGQHPTQADLDIGKMLRPLMTAWTNYETSLHPEDTNGLNTWNNNLEASLGSSNALHAFMSTQTQMVVNKYKIPLLPLEWYKAWNILAQLSGDTEAIISIPAGAVYSNEYVNNVVNNTKGTPVPNSGGVGSSFNIPGIGNLNMSSTNIFLILGLVGGLAYMFLKKR